jgi:hypothetical protein
MSALRTTLRRITAATVLAAALVTGTATAADAKPRHDNPATCAPLPTRCAGGDAYGFAMLGVILGNIATGATR